MKSHGGIAKGYKTTHNIHIDTVFFFPTHSTRNTYVWCTHNMYLNTPRDSSSFSRGLGCVSLFCLGGIAMEIWSFWGGKLLWDTPTPRAAGLLEPQALAWTVRQPNQTEPNHYHKFAKKSFSLYLRLPHHFTFPPHSLSVECVTHFSFFSIEYALVYSFSHHITWFIASPHAFLHRLTSVHRLKTSFAWDVVCVGKLFTAPLLGCLLLPMFLPPSRKALTS